MSRKFLKASESGGENQAFKLPVHGSGPNELRARPTTTNNQRPTAMPTKGQNKTMLIQSNNNKSYMGFSDQRKRLTTQASQKN